MTTAVRGVESVEDVWAAEDVNRAAWRTAFADVFSPHVLATGGAAASEPYIRSRYAVVRDHPGFVVATEGDDVVGYAYAAWTDTSRFVDDDEAELVELYVHPDHWGQGIGTRLLAAAEAAVPADRTSLVLATPAGNDIGRSFYESRGFTVRERRAGDVGGEVVPTVVFARALSENQDDGSASTRA
ncbi:GNAT family N-acetyltransferase [Haloarchaeobius amylolyticus]|uniref:GNAT family N-acetyltransferase n=1 Tax=Haloarchaeobius amylolyticus TaxID=1198296 RepID=UPI0022706CC4|nr:GNAT family N-acetyltransferase [Haloarchaeobius amylolyticus]